MRHMKTTTRESSFPYATNQEPVPSGSPVVYPMVLEACFTHQLPQLVPGPVGVSYQVSTSYLIMVPARVDRQYLIRRFEPPKWVEIDRRHPEHQHHQHHHRCLAMSLPGPQLKHHPPLQFSNPTCDLNYDRCAMHSTCNHMQPHANLKDLAICDTWISIICRPSH